MLKDLTIHHPLGDSPPKARLLYGIDVIEGLKLLDTASVQTICTSPPYWGLRDYGTGDEQLGLEETPEAYIERMVKVFREAKRVLRKDGTLWLNLGDSYAGNNRGGMKDAQTAQASVEKNKAAGNTLGQRHTGVYTGPLKAEGLKPKDMVGMPWRVAFALQADGWYLRAAAPWIKRNCMPESCKDRPTSAVEYIFLFSHPEGRARYFYDVQGARAPLAAASHMRLGQSSFSTQKGGEKDYGTSGTNANRSARQGVENLKARLDSGDATRQLRATDWFFLSLDAITAGQQVALHSEDEDPLAFVVNPKGYPGAHFATWPPELVEPMIKTSTSERGCCAKCGQPKVRGAGWEAPCDCEAGEARCVVLDPFSGSATTGMVALKQGRDYVGIDLNEDYLELATHRVLGIAAPKATENTESGVLDMFGG